MEFEHVATTFEHEFAAAFESDTKCLQMLWNLRYVI